MTNAKTIREACLYEAKNNLKGNVANTLAQFAEEATDAELVRFAQLINNVVVADGCLSVPAMDSADLARANID